MSEREGEGGLDRDLKRIPLGVIGCGFFAQNHLHAWRDLHAAGVDLVAVCDVDPQKAQRAAATFGAARWYLDAAQMLREEHLGLVDIVTQMDTHQDLVAAAMGERVPVIVQKPFGPDLASCESMVAAADAAGVFLAVHENFRFQWPLRRSLEAVRSGAIGEPTWARVSFRTGYDIYSGQPYLRDVERFILLDVGVHVLDVARLFLGEVDELTAQTQRRNPNVRGEDTATMLMKHRSGAVSVVECTYDCRRLPDVFPQTRLEIEGTQGALVLDAGYRMEITSGGQVTRSEVDAPMLPWSERPWHVVQHSVLATCTDLVEALRAGRPAETSGHDNLRTFALCEAAYEAAASGRATRPRF